MRVQGGVLRRFAPPRSVAARRLAYDFHARAEPGVDGDLRTSKSVLLPLGELEAQHFRDALLDRHHNNLVEVDFQAQLALALEDKGLRLRHRFGSQRVLAAPAVLLLLRAARRRR